MMPAAMDRTYFMGRCSGWRIGDAYAGVWGVLVSLDEAGLVWLVNGGPALMVRTMGSLLKRCRVVWFSGRLGVVVRVEGPVLFSRVRDLG